MIQVENFSDAKNIFLDAIQFGAFHMADDGTHSFHYTSLSGLKGILDSRQFYVTEYHYLNDMEEFEYVDDLLRETLEEETGSSHLYEFLKEAVEKYLQQSRVLHKSPEESFYVLSFSKEKDNLTLWAEFASYGCNFEANPYAMFDEGLIYHSVIYDRNDQKDLVRSSIRSAFENFFVDVNQYSVEPALSEYLDTLNESQIDIVAECIVELVVYYGMLMKNSLYESEKEFRVIFSGKGKEIFYREKENMFVPYIKMPLAEGHWLGDCLTLAPLNHTESCRNSIQSYFRGLGYDKVQVEYSKIRLRY